MNAGDKRWFWLLVCIFLVAYVRDARALDPSRALSQYTVEHWQADQGLPHSAIHAIVQTRDGYLWLGTEAGLTRFDGVAFTVFDKQSTGGLLENFVYRLAETPDGSLWIGTRGGGLARYQKGKFRRFTTADGLADEHIYALTVGRDGSVWAGTRSGGISRYQNGKFTTLSTKDGLADVYVLSLFEDRNGAMWAGLYDGTVDRIQNGKITHFEVSYQVRAFAEDANGVLQAGADSGGLLVFDNDHFEQALTADDVNGNIVSMCRDAHGNLWLGAKDGAAGSLCRYRPKARPEILTAQTGLSSDDVNAVYEDREGGLWVGTETGGLNHLKDGKFVTYGVREGLSDDDVLGIRPGRYEGVLIGTRSGLNFFTNGGFSVATLDGGGNVNHITTMLEDSDSVWFANVAGGLHRLKAGVHTYFGAQAGFTDSDIWALYEGKDKALWAGARNGLFRLKDGIVTRYTKADGLSDSQIRTILEDRQGTLWIGTQGAGINSFRDGVFRHWGRKEGLSDGSVRCLFEDSEGVLWIGTRDGGLNRFKDGKFTVYSTANGLPQDTVFSILEDDAGCLWVGSNKDIFRLKKQELADVANGLGRRVHPAIFGEMDGIRSSECNGGYMLAACRTADGRLWFTTKKGVAVVNPRQLRMKPPAPPAAVEKILVDHEAIEVDPEKAVFTFPPGDGDLEIHYTALTLSNPARVKFRFQLEGFDKGWVEAGNRRTAFYTNLRPGHYRFRVVAANEEGAWNETGAAVYVELKPHFYQSSWFILAGGLVVALMVFGGYRYRVSLGQTRELELESLVRERTKALRDEISERKRGEEMLRESEKRFRTLASHAPVGIFQTDAAGDCLFVNERWCEMTGQTPELARGRGWMSAFHPDDAERVTEAWRRAVTGGQNFAEEFRFRSLAGNVTSLTVSAVPLHGPQGEVAGFLGTFTDITELKNAEESISRQRALLTNVIEHIPCGVFWKNRECVYLGCNETFAHTLGLRSPADVVGKTDYELPCSKEEADWFTKCDRQVISEGRPMLNVEEPLTRPDGQPSVVLTSKVPLHDPDGRVAGILGIFTDIGDQKKIQEALRGLPQRIIDAQEMERRRVARELHDGVIQLLSTAKFRMQSFGNAPAGATATTAASAKQPASPAVMLDKAIREIRRISRNLRPSELDDLGLLPAMRSICDEYEQRMGVKVELVCERAPERLPASMELALYRIVQEALTNIEKHAAPASVKLNLRVSESEIELSIKDDGIGFDPTQGSIHYGRETCMGLVDMKERAAFVEGTLVIHSQPGMGTEINLKIPVATSTNQGEIKSGDRSQASDPVIAR